MDSETVALMDRLAHEAIYDEGSQLEYKMRAHARESSPYGLIDSPMNVYRRVQVHYKHYKETAAAAWKAMLRAIQDTDGTVTPGMVKELLDRFDGYTEQCAKRVSGRMSDFEAQGFPGERFGEVFNRTRQHYHSEAELWVRKAMVDKKRGSNVNVTYNLTGANPRVNINSEDYSITIQNAQPIFEELRKAIQAGVEDQELKAKLITKASEMETAVADKPKFLEKYGDFMALAANHMAVFGQLIPAITQYLQ